MTYATASDAVRPSFVAGVGNAHLAALVLRVSTGVLFLAHAGLKLFVSRRRARPASSRASASRVPSPISSSRPNCSASR